MPVVNKTTVKSYFTANAKPTVAEFVDFIDSYTDGFIFTSDPTENDDDTAGYVIGSLWTNSVSEESFICTNDTTGNAVWKKVTNNYYEFLDTFVAIASTAFWTITVNGAGAAQSAIAPGTGGNDTGVIGVIQLTTGTTAAGRAGILTSANLLYFRSGNTYVFNTKIRIPALSTAAAEFGIRVGFIDLITAVESTDGAYFEYIRTNSVNWGYTTSSNSTRTKVNSTTAVDLNWVDLKIVVDATAPSAKFYINNVLVGTNTTNIPTASGREFGIGIVIYSTVGVGGKTVHVDKIGVRVGKN
ncbi:hypothetical protein CCP1ISM_20057 [Azospirillaceae bacterium]